MDGLGYACALLLAAVFVRAGAAKLARPAAIAAGFSALGVPGAAKLGRAVPFVELVVAVGLVAAPRVGAVAALVLLLAFTVFLARALRSGVTAPCNCFGAARADPVSATDVARNALLAALAVVSLGASAPAVPAPLAAVVAAAAFAGGWLALAAARDGRGVAG